MINKNKELPERIKASNVKDLKYSFGLTQHDLGFLYGRALDFSINDKKIMENDVDIKSVTFSVMIRALNKDKVALPIESITFQEIFDLIKPYEPDLSIGKISIYFGLGYWPANDWLRGESKPSRRVILAFVMAKRLIEAYGEEGWEIWKKSLEEEAIARGTTFEKVLKTGTWKTEDSADSEED
jgi:hypothetical protein